MNWFNLLKNKAGKLAMSTQKALLISAGVGIIGATVMQNLVEPGDSQNMAVRSLSSVSNNFDYGSMHYTDNGTGLTSINVSDETGTIQTSQRNSSEVGDFGLSAADNMDAKVASSFVGRGSSLGETEGLGKSPDVDLSGYSSGNSTASGQNSVSSHSYSPRANGSGDANYSTSRGSESHSSEPTQIASLGTASMTRASGSGINASYGNFSGSSSGGSRNGSSRSSGGKSSGSSYNFSGAMPSGTNPVSLSGADGRGSSRFMAGTTRATVAKGSQSGAVKGELADISKRSADAARLAGQGNASNTEAGRAFLASAQNSGGISMDSGMADAERVGSADFKSTEAPQLRGLKRGLSDINNSLKTRNDAMSEVIKWMLLTLGVAIAGVIAIAYLQKIPNPYVKWIGSGLVAGVMVWFASAMMTKAVRFHNNFPDDSSWSVWVGSILSGLTAAGIAFAMLKPESIQAFIKENIGGALKTVAGKGIDMGANALKMVVKSNSSTTDTSNQNNSNNNGK